MPTTVPQLEYTIATKADVLAAFTYKVVTMTIKDYKNLNITKYIDWRFAEFETNIVLCDSIVTQGYIFLFPTNLTLFDNMVHDMSKGAIILVVTGANEYILLEGFNRFEISIYILSKIH